MEKKASTLKRLLKLLLIGIAGLFIGLALIAFGAYPFLTAEEHLDSDILVVEGWQSDEALQEAAELFLSGNYKTLITTGGRKVSSHYLEMGQNLIYYTDPSSSTGIEVNDLIINVSGINGASFRLLADDSLVLNANVTGLPQDFEASLSKPIRTLSVSNDNKLPVVEGVANIFIKYILLDGNDINGITNRVFEHDTTYVEDLEIGENLATISRIRRSVDHANTARDKLIELGIFSEMILSAPGDSIGTNRTKHNALGLQKELEDEGLLGSPITLFTTGIHARRSRILYEQAVSQPIGLIVHKDPEFAPYTWWTDAGKWRKIVSELGGCIYYIWLGYEKNISHWIDKIGNNEGVP